MAVYKIETVKYAQPVYHTPEAEFENVYHLEASTTGDAETAAIAIATAELPLLDDRIFINRVRITSGPGVGKVLHTTDLQGGRSDLTDILPPWNVALINFGLTSSTRHLAKYFRITAQEADIEGEFWNSDILDLLNAYATAVLAAGTITNPDGTLEADAGNFYVFPSVRMRQPHWERRARPGFHREYVPNS